MCLVYKEKEKEKRKAFGLFHYFCNMVLREKKKMAVKRRFLRDRSLIDIKGGQGVYKRGFELEALTPFVCHF